MLAARGFKRKQMGISGVMFTGCLRRYKSLVGDYGVQKAARILRDWTGKYWSFTGRPNGFMIPCFLTIGVDHLAGIQNCLFPTLPKLLATEHSYLFSEICKATSTTLFLIAARNDINTPSYEPAHPSWNHHSFPEHLHDDETSFPTSIANKFTLKTLGYHRIP